MFQKKSTKILDNDSTETKGYVHLWVKHAKNLLEQ